MRCPICVLAPATSGPYRDPGLEAAEHRELVPEQHPAGITLDRCPSCRGAFLEHGELERVEAHLREHRRGAKLRGIDYLRRAYEHARHPEGAPELERPPRDCPACDQVMFEREWGIGTFVRVDVCLDCRGVWLDPGELEALEASYGGRAPA